MESNYRVIHVENLINLKLQCSGATLDSYQPADPGKLDWLRKQVVGSNFLEFHRSRAVFEFSQAVGYPVL